MLYHNLSIFLYVAYFITISTTWQEEKYTAYVRMNIAIFL